MRKSKEKLMVKICSFALAAVMVFAPTVTVMAEDEDWKPNRVTHGTASEWISEDEVNNTPPADYKVNEETQGKAEDGEYNKYFLKDSIQTVNIEVDETNFNYLVQNAVAEPYVLADSVTIGDAKVEYVGLKTKGAYTLLHSYTENPKSDRFSFTINFGKYIKKADYGEKQDFFGCNKISFNNFFFDKSMLKEFCSFMIMKEMGLPTPQFGLAKLYINGEYYGVYAMVEAMDESILEQYYGVDGDELSSYLCKPEGTTFKYDDIMEDDSPLWENDEGTYKDVEDMLPTVKEWVRRLNLLSEGKDFDGNEIDVNSDKYIELVSQIYDLDEVLKYFAAHSWLCQLDSIFVGKKNFGLYVDQDGKAMIVPWDYDLSFGCYYPATAQLTANYDIDALYMLAGWGQDISRYKVHANSYNSYPMFKVIFQNEQLMERYHGYMKDCSKIAALGGTVEATGKVYNPGYLYSYIEALENELVDAASEKLASNVYYMNHTNQPRDVKNALPNLKRIIALRAVGVLLQVEDSDSVVCAAGCDLATLGNGQWGFSENSGNITLVNPMTGIYVTADVSGSSRMDPTLTINEEKTDDKDYIEIKNAIGITEDDRLTVYQIKTNAKIKSDADITVPVDAKYLAHEGDIKFYSYVDGVLTELSATSDDNLYTVTVSDIEYIAVMQIDGNVEGTDVWPWIVGIAAAVVIIIVVIVVVICIRKKKNSGKQDSEMTVPDETVEETKGETEANS